MIMGIERICGIQPVIEPAKVEFMVSASVQAGSPGLVGLASLRSAQSRGPLDLVSPLRPNGVFVSTRGYKLEQCGDKRLPHTCEGVF